MKRTYLFLAALLFSMAAMAQTKLELKAKKSNQKSTLNYTITGNKKQNDTIAWDIEWKDEKLGEQSTHCEFIRKKTTKNEKYDKFLEDIQPKCDTTSFNKLKKTLDEKIKNADTTTLKIHILPIESKTNLAKEADSSNKKVATAGGSEPNTPLNNTDSTISTEDKSIYDSYLFFIITGIVILLAGWLFYVGVLKDKKNSKRKKNASSQKDRKINPDGSDTSSTHEVNDEQIQDNKKDDKKEVKQQPSQKETPDESISKELLKNALGMNKNNPSEKEILNEIKKIKAEKEKAESSLKAKEPEITQLTLQHQKAEKERKSIQQEKDAVVIEKIELEKNLKSHQDLIKKLQEENQQKDKQAEDNKKQNATLSTQLIEKYYTSLLKEIKNEEDERKIKQSLIEHLVQISLHSKSHFVIQAGLGKGEDDMNMKLIKGEPVSPSKTVSINSAPNEQDSLTRAIIMLMKDYGMKKIDGVFINGIKISE